MPALNTDNLMIDRGGTLYRVTAAELLALLGVVKGFSAFVGGKSTANEVVLSTTAQYAFTITQAKCSAVAQVAATASTVFQLKRTRGGSTVNVCTFTFAAAGTIATVGTVTNGAILEGDVLTIYAPATPDTTLSDPNFIVRQ